MNLFRPCIFALLVVATLNGSSAKGAVLAQWNGQNTFLTSYPDGPNSVNARVLSSLTLQDYEGFTPISNTSNSWAGVNTTNTIDLEQYVSFTLTMRAGWEADLTSFQFALRLLNPDDDSLAIIRSSLDNYSSNLATFTPSNDYQTFTVDLNSFAPVSTITIRFYGINSPTANAQWNMINASNVTASFNGDVMMVPEPSTWALLLIATGALAVGYRKHRPQKQQALS